METQKFKVGNRIYELALAVIPPQSHLFALTRTSMKVEQEDDVIVLFEDEDEEPAFSAVMDYLRHGIFPSWEHLPTFSYLGIDPRSDYSLACSLEEHIRTSMYDPLFKQDRMNTDPYYGLIPITEELWEQLEISRPKDPNLLFTRKLIEKRSWEQVQSSLQELNPLFSIDGLFVAGGRVFSALFGTPVNDIDLFLYGCPEDEAMKRIFQLQRLVRPSEELYKKRTALSTEENKLYNMVHSDKSKHSFHHLKTINSQMKRYQTPENQQEIVDLLTRVAGIMRIDVKFVDGSPKFERQELKAERDRLTQIYKEMAVIDHALEMSITRTANALSFKTQTAEYQIILRLYRSPSEILHGFDVDCCSLGWDGKTLWMTQRALYSICNGYNTVNFGRLSPSYEYRLAKYGARGVAVKIPQFKRNQLDREALEEHFDSTLKRVPYGPRDPETGEREIKGHHVVTDYRQLRDPRKKMALKGLDILVYLDFQVEKRNYRQHTLNAIQTLAEKSSDYSGRPFKNNYGLSIGEIIDRLVDTKDNYPEYSERYMQYFGGEVVEFYFDTNLFPRCRQFDFVRTYGPKEERLKLLCDIPSQIYDGLAIVRPWMLPRRLEWKTIHPGEQMTGTFHKTVLEDQTVWYRGRFYRL